MKEKRSYKRFDVMSFWAVMGCVTVMLFESVFIFELYDYADFLKVSKPAVEFHETMPVAPETTPSASETKEALPSEPIAPVG